MASITASMEKLQPCVFDRLIDEAPDQLQESRNARIVTLSRYREGVLRDVAWLLNCSAHMPEEGLSEFPEVEGSVFNIGTRGLTGLVASGIDPVKLEQEIRRAILHFEPRIIPKTLVIRAGRNPEKTSPNVMMLEISGDLWAQPFPEKLFIKTTLDVENGTISI